MGAYTYNNTQMNPAAAQGLHGQQPMAAADICSQQHLAAAAAWGQQLWAAAAAWGQQPWAAAAALGQQPWAAAAAGDNKYFCIHPLDEEWQNEVMVLQRPDISEVSA